MLNREDDNTPQRIPKRRRLLALGVGLVVGLVALEVILQVAAYVIWMGGASGASRPEAERVALCVGDSFTYGLHATSPEQSYPAQAQRAADAQGPGDWAFVNGGVPGQTSRDVLQRLPGLLQQHQPDVVYVLVGTNDYFFRPAKMTTAGEPAGYPVRWRTLRLAQVLVEALRRSPPAEQGAPFVGLWHNSHVEFEFSSDGRFRFGDQYWQWTRQTDDRLRLQTPDGAQMSMQWRMDGVRLRVESDLFGAPNLLEPGALPGPLVEVLQHHLGLVAAVCAAAESRCVLLNYPPEKYAVPGLNEALRSAASEVGVELIDVEARFHALGDRKARAPYFVTDGHCSDLGYGVMARSVLEHARELR